LMLAAVEHRFGPVNRLPVTIEWLSDNGSCYLASETRDARVEMERRPKHWRNAQRSDRGGIANRPVLQGYSRVSQSARPQRRRLNSFSRKTTHVRSANCLSRRQLRLIGRVKTNSRQCDATATNSNGPCASPSTSRPGGSSRHQTHPTRVHKNSRTGT
jgi:hypothetical protein